MGTQVMKRIMRCNLPEDDYPVVKLWKIPTCLATMSAKISIAARDVMPAELARRLDLAPHDCIKQGRTVPGRVCLRFICDWYKSTTVQHA